MRRELTYWLAALTAAFGLGFAGLRRYSRSAGQRRTPGESRTAFVHRVTRPHLRRFGDEMVTDGGCYDMRDEDEPRRAA